MCVWVYVRRKFIQRVVRKASTEWSKLFQQRNNRLGIPKGSINARLPRSSATLSCDLQHKAARWGKAHLFGVYACRFIILEAGSTFLLKRYLKEEVIQQNSSTRLALISFTLERGKARVNSGKMRNRKRMELNTSHFTQLVITTYATRSSLTTLNQKACNSKWRRSVVTLNFQYLTDGSLVYHPPPLHQDKKQSRSGWDLNSECKIPCPTLQRIWHLANPLIISYKIMKPQIFSEGKSVTFLTSPNTLVCDIISYRDKARNLWSRNIVLDKHISTF